MPETCEYLAPDYYPSFACKMGACRSCCCDGWNVSLSMQDYFRLLGVECKKQLRDRLDVALRPALNPTPEHYAEIEHRFDGDCPLRMADGRCAIHAQLGEMQLPAICRLYPRALRGEGDLECSCACSCERVVEMLLERAEPLKFIPLRLAQTPPQQGNTVFRERFAGEQALRLKLIHLVQDGARPLPQRLWRLGLAMAQLEDGADAGFDPAALPESNPMPNAATPAAALEAALKLVEMLDERSAGLRQFGETALQCLDTDVDHYAQACARFKADFPRWASGFSNLIANHMFFTRFPYSDGSESLRHEFASLCALYAAMRVLATGYTARHGGGDALVDVLAALFRLADHSSFHHYAAVMLGEMHFDAPKQLAALLAL